MLETMRLKNAVVILLTLAVSAIATSTRAEDSALERLENAGVRVRATHTDADGTTGANIRLFFPRGWTWTHEYDGLIRKLISTLDKPPTLYVSRPRLPEHKMLDVLAKDHPELSVKWMSGTFLGVTTQPFNSINCTVNSVIPDTPAQRAGMMKGDTIVRINEVKIKNFDALNKSIRRFLPGDEIEIYVRRGSKDLSVRAKLGLIDLQATNNGEPSDAPKDRASRIDNGKPTAGPR